MRRNPFDALPDFVCIDGERVEINPSFRVGIAIENEVLKEESPDVAGLLSLFYRGEIPGNISGAVDAMLEFFRAAIQNDEEQPDEKTKHKGRAYDFEQDAEVIAASFLSIYGIDLTNADLHWWAFRRLLFNLPHESLFMQRVMYRTADIASLSKSQKKHFKKMRALYAIKDGVVRGGKLTAEERDALLLERINRRYKEAEAYASQKKNE